MSAEEIITYCFKTMHRTSVYDNRCTKCSQLQPGCLVAPREFYLPLLPFRPDGVHKPLPHKTRFSTPLSIQLNPITAKPHSPEFSLTVADCELQGTASSPPSMVIKIILNNKKNIHK